MGLGFVGCDSLFAALGGVQQFGWNLDQQIQQEPAQGGQIVGVMVRKSQPFHHLGRQGQHYAGGPFDALVVAGVGSGVE